MTISNNTPTRSVTNAHEGQTVAGTNQPKEFKVLFHLAQRSYGTAIVEASSQDEAREKASLMNLDAVNDWEVFEDDMTVESIEIIGKRKTND